jgi:predicted nuclease with RNAse H fold
MSNKEIKIIGIDCSTDPKKTGIACGLFDGKKTKIKKVHLGSPVVQTIFDWTSDNETVLIAIDAPLGWPEKLGCLLVNHRAGNSMNIDPDKLFRRVTDTTVEQRIHKRPLDVGANLIARTAHKALEIIEQLRKQKKLTEIPLAWKKELESGISVIEVYPAATLKAHSLLKSNYKEKEELRKEIISGIGGIIELPKDPSDTNDLLLKYVDVLDAAICVLAAHDFLIDDVIKPDNIELACKEGWIWVKNNDEIKLL